MTEAASSLPIHTEEAEAELSPVVAETSDEHRDIQTGKEDCQKMSALSWAGKGPRERQSCITLQNNPQKILFLLNDPAP